MTSPLESLLSVPAADGASPLTRDTVDRLGLMAAETCPAFIPLDRPISPDDDTNKTCGFRIFGHPNLDIFTIYRPLIRNTVEDEREDRFDPGALPVNDSAILVGDLNAHHPLWDSAARRRMMSDSG